MWPLQCIRTVCLYFCVTVGAFMCVCVLQHGFVDGFVCHPVFLIIYNFIFFLLSQFFHTRYQLYVFVWHNYFKVKNNVYFLWIYDIKLCFVKLTNIYLECIKLVILGALLPSFVLWLLFLLQCRINKNLWSWFLL